MGCRWKSLLGMVVIFVAGTVVGAAGTVGYLHRRLQEHRNPDTWTPRTLNWLRHEVQLTPEQEPLVRPAIEESMADLVRLRDRADQDRRAIFARMFVQVHQSLPPEQQERLKAAVEKAQAKDMLK